MVTKKRLTKGSTVRCPETGIKGIYAGKGKMGYNVKRVYKGKTLTIVCKRKPRRSR